MKRGEPRIRSCCPFSTVAEQTVGIAGVLCDGNRIRVRFVQPDATHITGVYDLDGKLVGVHGQYAPGNEVCLGEKGKGTCVALHCGDAAQKP
jgi:hypothetical protein